MNNYLVIIPTIGKEMQKLDAAVASVRALKHERVDLVIISPESSELRNFCASRNLKHIFEVDKGVFAAMNQVILEIGQSYDYFCFLGDDDELISLGTLQIINTLETRHYDITYGQVEYVDNLGKSLFTNKTSVFALSLLPWIPNLIPHPGTFISIRHFEHLKGYSLDFPITADLEFWLRARSKKLKFKRIKTPVAKFRLDSQTISGGQRKAAVDEAIAIRNLFLPKVGNVLHRKINLTLTLLGEVIVKKFRK